jgi:hypothetical protein
VQTRQNGDRSLDRGNMTKTPLPERVSSSFARAMMHTATNNRQIGVSASIVAARPHFPFVCLDPGKTYLDTVNSPTPLWQEYPAGAALAGTGRGGEEGRRAASPPASTAGRLRVGQLEFLLTSRYKRALSTFYRELGCCRRYGPISGISVSAISAD